jgi:phosphatidylethanolamine-binding protein (PEBP) family uncharacterized protein
MRLPWASNLRWTAFRRTPSLTPARFRTSGTGKGPFGAGAWAGPMPIRSHGPRAYVFQLFALDQATDLPDGFALDEAIAVMATSLAAPGWTEHTKSASTVLA